jgi:hypothetical protein
MWAKEAKGEDALNSTTILPFVNGACVAEKQ